MLAGHIMVGAVLLFLTIKVALQLLVPHCEFDTVKLMVAVPVLVGVKVNEGPVCVEGVAVIPVTVQL